MSRQRAHRPGDVHHAAQVDRWTPRRQCTLAQGSHTHDHRTFAAGGADAARRADRDGHVGLIVDSVNNVLRPCLIVERRVQLHWLHSGNNAVAADWARKLRRLILGIHAAAKDALHRTNRRTAYGALT